MTLVFFLAPEDGVESPLPARSPAAGLERVVGPDDRGRFGGRGLGEPALEVLLELPECRHGQPRRERMVEAAGLVAAQRGDRVEVVGLGDPDEPDRDLYATGVLLPSPRAKLAGPTVEEWLNEHWILRQVGDGRPRSRRPVEADRHHQRCRRQRRRTPPSACQRLTPPIASVIALAHAVTYCACRTSCR